MINTIKKIYNFLPAKYQKKYTFLVFLILINTIFETIGIGIVLPVFALFTDTGMMAIRNKVNFIDRFSDEEIIYGALFILIIFYIFKSIYSIFLINYQNRTSFKLSAFLSGEIYKYYLNQEYVNFIQKSSGEIISDIITEVKVFTDGLLLPVANLISEILVIAAIIVLILFIQPANTIYVMAALFLVALIFYVFTRRKLDKYGIIRQVSESKRIKAVNQGISAIREVKLFNAKKLFIKRFQESNNLFNNMMGKKLTIELLPRIVLELLAILGIVLVVLVMYAYHGKKPEEIIPVITIFAAAAFRLAPSINKIIVNLQQYTYGKTSIEKLGEIPYLDNIGTDDIKNNYSFKENIVFKNVVFRYPNRNEIAINNLSFQINKNDIVGIFGASGGGKSTVLDIMMGLLKPESGFILIDGVDINSSQTLKNSWRSIVSYVSQNIYLMDGTILDNVIFSSDTNQFSLSKARDCLIEVGLWEFVSGLPKGLNTPLGERGLQLSGGQKQRIGIARALYKKPEVLILDESTSALDSKSEEVIIEMIKRLSNKLTLIIVAHRLTTLSCCNKFFKISPLNFIELKKYEDVLSLS